MRDALFTTPPYQGQPPPDLGGAHGPRMLAVTGRFGDGWFATQKLTPQQYAASLAQIHSAATEAGRSMDHFEPAIQVLVALGPNREAAIEGLLRVPLRTGGEWAVGEWVVGEWVVGEWKQPVPAPAPRSA
ncbi:MAG TPA: LLM class flavin-dependent oxidoreductase [Nakamurella sp.]|nr:LLM class flavin-dependent oxidoreductase [Nakamurella sp.]